MLAMFAAGDYRGAAMEAHAAASLGQPMKWETLYGFYGDVKPYTEQLRKLEQHVTATPNDPAARFLLGYQYLMMGHNDAAKTELTKALIAAPRDRLAAHLLTQIGGTVPESVLKIQKEMEKNMPKAVQCPAPAVRFSRHLRPESERRAEVGWRKEKTRKPRMSVVAVATASRIRHRPCDGLTAHGVCGVRSSNSVNGVYRTDGEEEPAYDAKSQ